MIADRLYNAILAREVLTLNRDYFRLDGGLERRIYELARKHCGRQANGPSESIFCTKRAGQPVR
jgi:plasmid replication initiation protein